MWICAGLDTRFASPPPLVPHQKLEHLDIAAVLFKNGQNLTKNVKKWQNLAKICAVFDPRVPMGQKLSISNQRQIAFTFAKKKAEKTTKILAYSTRSEPVLVEYAIVNRVKIDLHQAG